MSLYKFIHFVQTRKLFFSRPDAFEDRFEGSFSRGSAPERLDSYKGVVSNWQIIEAHSELGNLFRRFFPLFTMVNCWSMRDHESAALWKLYASEQEGVAVQTTFESLRDIILCEEDFYIGEIKYIDYSQSGNSMGEFNALSQYYRKWINFEYENEARVVIKPSIPTGTIEQVLSQQMPYPGKGYDVDLPNLIKKITVAPFAPDGLAEFVRGFIQEHGLEVDVARSSRCAPPFWY